MYARMLVATEQHGVKPAIDGAFPFARAAGAFRALEKGGHFGKIVVEFEQECEEPIP